MPGISRYLMARKSLPDPPMMAARAQAAHEETSNRSQKPEARSALSCTEARIGTFWLLASSPLKHVLQRKLQDSWICRRQYLSKHREIDRRHRVVRIHVIWKVERLGSELQRLILPNLETSSHSHVDLN